jgi:hypothetical protein
VVAVDHGAEHRGQDEEGDEDIEHRQAGVEEVQEVDGQQAGGHRSADRRPDQPPAEQVEHRDHQRAGDQRRDPPAAAVEPEHLDPRGDQPLSKRRVLGGDLVRLAASDAERCSSQQASGP